jgi:PPK2 family polyphosphate:nucleotide phosphotransferase
MRTVRVSSDAMPDLARATLVSPGSKVGLDSHPPDARLGLRTEEAARARTAKRAERMAELATMLMAERKRSVLVVLQGMDASGKDGVVKHCLGGLNPMSVRVAGFKAPSSTELAHDFLWRIHQVLPERGELGIFNRSHYEDVLVVRVEELVPKQIWKQRYAAINAFEQHLANEGTTVVKFFLHISEEEQAERFRARLADRSKNWKFSADDLAKRAKWGQYMTAYRAVLERTSTKTAPWHIVPSDHKWVRDAVVTEVLTQTLEGLGLQWPELSPELKALAIT